MKRGRLALAAGCLILPPVLLLGTMPSLRWTISAATSSPEAAERWRHVREGSPIVVACDLPALLEEAGFTDIQVEMTPTFLTRTTCRKP